MGDWIKMAATAEPLMETFIKPLELGDSLHFNHTLLQSYFDYFF